MTAVTIANAVLARRQDSELLAFMPWPADWRHPALLAMGHDNESLSLLLPGVAERGRAAAAGIAPMEAAGLGRFAGHGGFYYIGWTLSAYSPTHFPITAFFLACFSPCLPPRLF
jgi:hypothetical protein